MDELKTNDYLRGIVQNLPDSPGIYQYLNDEGTIIYVGKAKNLKRRVSSYFNREHEAGKTRILVSKIRDIRYIVVKTEEDALLLENNLIKKYKPRYNVLLKDDKTYPSICIQNEWFPRVFRTRKIIRNGSSYYGPYSHVPTMYALLDLIKHLFPLRTCHHNLTPESIRAGKYHVCLEYHIKNCAAPCVGKQSHDEYMQNIAQIKEILKGNTREIEQKLYQEMQKLAEELKFEEAQAVKEKYLLLENYRAKSEVVSHVLHNIDVFSIEEDTDGQSAFINYLHITNGAINQAFTFEYKKRLNESKEELLGLGIVEMRERYKSLSREIIVPFDPGIELKNVVFTVPQRGDKKTLLDLSVLNVKQYKADRLKQADKLNPEQRATRLLKEIQDTLHLDRLPIRIECFDNSNIQGADPVAGCVVFIKGKPSKKDYRKYNIKTVEGPDDYASMQEVVRRKYTRAMEEDTPLPDLLITDGGKGQMSAVQEVLDELGLDIPVAGLAKDNRHRTSELLFGNPPQVIGMKQTSPLFLLLTRIQNEVHRYAITFHREKRSKRQISSELDEIKGIGPKAKEALLKEFKSVKRIREASAEALEAVIGRAKAQIIQEYFAQAKTPEKG
ncbi:excinuclease ABC subunit C [Mediterranea sp. An20]|uniref:excinuclease ABC subunit UvrC n=1 Tax=Mediterranea sp. An20 TaxID=1965586 RepID=UPI000B3A1233|nr:excinuclease ABC subunit UvrC [Mediterranea sp. An20]OUP06756.1 excinuclease ABC subunit C [Mediterranea sp. An20]